MIELPFTPYFFEKLSIYQRIRRGDRITTGKKLWKMEKHLLMWTVRGHQFLYDSLPWQACREKLEEKFKEVKKNSGLVSKVMGNLVQRGLADPLGTHLEDPNQAVIRFTPKGLAWGDVLYEIEHAKTWWGKNKYDLFIYGVWTLLVIFGLNLFLDLLQKLF